jgi:hypothetical protein
VGNPATPRDPAERRLAALLDELQAEFPGFRLVRKEESRLQRLIARLLRLLTAGGQNGYLERFVTTIGRTVYVNRGWDERTADDRYATLRHERIHLRQFRRFGLLPMSLAYLLLPLPAGLAWCRARLEWEAYAESLRAWAEVYGPDHLARPDVRAHVVAQFTGPSYGWMWPFPRVVEGWYEAARRAIVSGA